MKTLLFLAALLITLNLNAQWTTDTNVNTLVALSPSGDMESIGTSDGKTYVVFWKEVGEPTNYELRLQLLDASGNKLFGEDGMMISNTLNMSTYTVLWSIAVDADDNLLVGVTGTNDFVGHMFKIDINGNHLWDNDGISPSGEAVAFTFLPLASGDVIAAWGTGTQALMQKYDSEGSAVWDTPQQIISGNSKTWPANLFELSEGYFELIFHTYSYGISSTLWAQKYNAEGVSQFTNPTQLANVATVYNTYYSYAQDEDTVYVGYKAVANNRYDSYLQRVNPDGSIPWGINGSDFDVNQTNFEMDTKIAFAPESQYIWAISTYCDENQTYYGEYIQKFDKSTGARQFTDNAKMIYDLTTDMYIHAGSLQLMDDQPFFLLKIGYDNGALPVTLNALLLDQNGDFVWEEEYKPMATFSANKSRINLSKPVSGQTVAVFIEDKGNGGQIFAQNFINDFSLPGQPVLIFPEDQSVEIPVNCTFSWGGLANAESYNIQIASDVAFTNVIADETGITDSEFDYILPGYQITYYWHVQGINSNGNGDWSEVWSFTTVTGSSVDDKSPSKVHIYPNPASDFFRIEDASNISKVEISGLTGNPVKSLTLKNSNAMVHVTDLVSGMYLIKCYDNNGKLIATEKLIKK